MKLPVWCIIVAFTGPTLSSLTVNAAERTDRVLLCIPTLRTDNRTLDDAFRIALGDFAGNISLFQNGLLDQPRPVILAGLDYGRPWTRDASINAWNGGSLLAPQVAKDTLLSVVKPTGQGPQIGGQYWDRIVWSTGAWHHYLYTGDRQFLALALHATRNSLAAQEATEFDPERGLFRGPGWSDGVAGYPLAYADCGGSSAILDWPKNNPDQVSQPGYGIPMFALSTNCLHYSAYVVASQMARELDTRPDPTWDHKASALKKAIERNFWRKDQGIYRFLVGPFGDCDHQEGLGMAYALLFGVADPDQANQVLANAHVTPAGFPCAWPDFPRYASPTGQAVARHAGTVWPQIQGFWAEAAARAHRPQLFGHELTNLAQHARRDRQFAEIYHPQSGEVYGGMQEASGRGIILWEATSRQTWAATALVRMVLIGLAGMRCDVDGVGFEPCLPQDVQDVRLTNLQYRRATLDLTITGNGTSLKRCTVNGQATETPFVDAETEGLVTIVMQMGDAK